MNKRLVTSLLGKIILIESGCMLLPALISLIFGGSDLSAHLYSAGIVAVVGVSLSLIPHDDSPIRVREGFLIVGLSWLALSLFGGLPFWFSGLLNPVDSFLEATNGFATTGSTVLLDLDRVPHGILFWRSLMNWIGGMGVLVLTLALVPKLGVRSMHLLRAETSGLSQGKLVPTIGGTTRILYFIYFSLTLLLFFILMLCGMDWFDSLIHTFSVAGTGGFSSRSSGIGYYASPQIEIVIAIFMVLFGANFTLYYSLAIRHFKGVAKNEELRWYLISIAAGVLLVTFDIRSHFPSFLESLRHGFFHVSSAISSTGLAAIDYQKWPMFSRTLLLIMMLVGGCAGSTSGGLKIARMVVLIKSAGREINRILHPRGVSSIKLQGKSIDEDLVAQTQAFFFLYIVLIFLVTLVVSRDGFDFETTFTAAIAAVSNVGTGYGDIGPTGNYARFSPLSKIVLALAMIAGRLELYPVLLLLGYKPWRKNG